MFLPHPFLCPFSAIARSRSALNSIKKLLDNLASLPGIQAAGAGTDLPWTGYDGNADGYRIEGHLNDKSLKTTARYHAATPDYFRALGIPLLSGTLH